MRLGKRWLKTHYGPLPGSHIGAHRNTVQFSRNGPQLDKSYPRGFREQHGMQAAPRFGIPDPSATARPPSGLASASSKTIPTYNSYFWSMVSNPPVQIEPNIFYGQMDTLLQRQGLLFPVGSSSIQLNDKVPSI
jgi:hypothetical protein